MERKPRAAIYTLGCRTNQYESDVVCERLAENGFEICDPAEKADVYIVNTCSVTAEADRKSRQFIRRGKHLNPDAVVIAMGCYCQINPQKAFELGADFVCGTRNKLSAVDFAVRAVTGGFERRTEVGELAGVPMERMFMGHFKGDRAYLKIEDGCDNHCAYCIIRRARGNVVSRDPEEIGAEAKAIVRSGCREIVLTGIEVASYGRDGKGYTLADAVRAACESGAERVRLASLEPSVLNERLINSLKDCRGFLPSFHLSLQSGSADVLKRMRRKYNPDMVRRSVAMIKSAFPDAEFSADVIVGFPGETEEDFKETCRLCEDIGLYHIHIFPYSDRAGTEAEKMTGKVPPEAKSRRCAELAAVGEAISEKVYKSYIEKQIPLCILIEEKQGEYYFGHAQNMLDVRIKSDENLCGKIVKCVAVDYKNGCAYAALCGEGTNEKG